jgi:CubicO group peptidase (beta-lactamase class C family)
MHTSRSISLLAALTLLMAACQASARVPSVTQDTTPWPTRDWTSASPASQGMDAQLLASAVTAAKEEKIGLYSLLVIRNGVIVAETYFNGDDASTRREVYSCTKSFTGTLIGIAIDKGLIKGVDRPLSDFLPAASYANPDPRKAAITLENMLTMNSGLDWNESDATYSAMYSSSDWTKYVLGFPMRAQPGTEFNYCSGCSHVLSAVIQNQTSGTAKQFAKTNLLDPLGISGAMWESDAQGIPIGGWGLRLTPREMAKLGYLYLHKGQWNGKQIVSSAWVQAATQKHSATDNNLDYGYQWWIYPRFGAYAALGRYGQTIFVVPDKNLVIVTTAHIPAGHDPIFNLIDTYIVPAAKD